MPISLTNGLAIYYEKVGSGPPLILIPALPFDHNNWIYQVERFSEKFTTIAVDLRGLGQSAPCADSFSLDDMAKDILGVMNNQGMRRALWCDRPA